MVVLLINYKYMGFQFVEPTEEQKQLMQTFRDSFAILQSEILDKVESSRGLSLAMTKLEEASFWLNKAITKND